MRLGVLLGAAAGAILAASVAAQPLQLPGAQAPSGAGTQMAPPPSAPAGPSGSGLSSPGGGGAPSVPVGTEDKLLGKPMKRNGAGGEAVLQRIGQGYGLKLSAEGFQIANLTEPCAVSFGDQPLPLTSLGRPAGSPRYRLEAPICPMVFDILNGALLASEPAQPCMIEAAGCRVDLRGLWGADGASLVSQAREIERARTQAERAVREHYRVLLARADRNDQRLIAREQAAFSSERTEACRDYARETTHGFCHARFAEARAVELRRRVTGRDEPAEPKPRPRPRTPAQPQTLAPQPAIQ